MFGGTTIASAAFVPYTSLASCVFGEERCPLGQVCIDYIISYRTNYVVIAVIEGPEPVIDGEWIPAGMGW